MLTTPGKFSADQLFFHKPLLCGNHEAPSSPRKFWATSVPVKSAPDSCTKTGGEIVKGTGIEYLLVLRGSGRVI